MPDLTPDEVLRRLSAESTAPPSEKLGMGIHAVMYSGEPVGPLTIKTVRDLARQLLECREALRAVLDMEMTMSGFVLIPRLEKSDVSIAAERCLPETEVGA